MGMREEEWVAKFATAQPIDHILASPLGTHCPVTLSHKMAHCRQSGQTLNGKYLQAQWHAVETMENRQVVEGRMAFWDTLVSQPLIESDTLPMANGKPN